METKTFTSLKREPAFLARVQDILHQNTTFLRESHTYFPAGLSHDYFMWGLSSKNEYHRLFLEVSSMYNSAVLFAYNAESVIEEKFWPAYTHAISNWAGNGSIEPYTDNMAFHYLTNKKINPSFYDKQKAIMSQFYDASIAKMNGTKTPTTELLAPLRNDFVDFPFYQLHVNPNRTTRLLDQFITETGKAHSIEEINRDGWAVCVANIDLVDRAINFLDDHFLVPYLRERYRLRYEGQKALLEGAAITQEELLDARAPEIMVSYTLAYFFAATAVPFNLNQQLEHAYNSHVLQPVLEASDILIRIMNDLGPLASASPKTIEAIFDSLLTYYYQNSAATQSISDLFENWSADVEILPFFAIRLKKDLTMGEDNIARDYSAGAGSYAIYERLAFMQHSVQHYAKLYQSTKKQFELDLASLSAAMANPVYSQLTHRFVSFHEQIYGNNYQGINGEYAV